VADPLPTATVTVDGLVYEIEDGGDLQRSTAVASLPLVRYEPVAKGGYRFRESA